MNYMCFSDQRDHQNVGKINFLALSHAFNNTRQSTVVMSSVFIIANAIFFPLITHLSSRLTKAIVASDRTFIRIAVNSILVSASTLALNFLLTKLTQFPLSKEALATITILSVVLNILWKKIKSDKVASTLANKSHPADKVNENLPDKNLIDFAEGVQTKKANEVAIKKVTKETPDGQDSFPTPNVAADKLNENLPDKNLGDFAEGVQTKKANEAAIKKIIQENLDDHDSFQPPIDHSDSLKDLPQAIYTLNEEARNKLKKATENSIQGSKDLEIALAKMQKDPGNVQAKMEYDSTKIKSQQLVDEWLIAVNACMKTNAIPATDALTNNLKETPDISEKNIKMQSTFGDVVIKDEDPGADV